MAKANNLDLELVETIPATAPADYKKINALGKIPTFVGADGLVLSECIAIYIYGMLDSLETSRDHYCSPLSCFFVFAPPFYPYLCAMPQRGRFHDDVDIL